MGKFDYLKVSMSESLQQAYTKQNAFQTIVEAELENIVVDVPVTSVNSKTGDVVIEKADLGLDNLQNYGVATQGTAEAGTSDGAYMTPLKTKQAIDALQAVKKVNGKTGDVSITHEDVGASPLLHNHTFTEIPGLQAALDGKESLTGAQEKADKALGDAKTYADQKVAEIVDSAPEVLDTLREFAEALGNDPNFATTIANQIGNKVDKVEGKGLSTEDYTTAEKTKLAGIADNANNYVHPTTAGNKHIPTGGATGNYLKFSASGTAVWATPTTAEITESTTKKFVSNDQIASWDAKETPTGAQTKATQALTDAKTYVDSALAGYSPKIEAYKYMLVAEVPGQKGFLLQDIYNGVTDTLLDVAQNGWALNSGAYTIEGKILYLLEGVSKGTVISFTVLKNVPLKEQQSLLLDGDLMAGYFGKVTGLITGNDLSAKTGLTAGTTVVSGDITWLKFSHKHRTLLVADRVIKTAISWDSIQAMNLVKGKPIQIGDNYYLCRLMTGGDSNPAVFSGGEWYDTVRRFTPDTLDSHWSENKSWFQEITNSVSERLATHLLAVVSTSRSASNDETSVGYRPVLELL